MSNQILQDICGYLKKKKSKAISRIISNTNLRWFEINFKLEIFGYKLKKEKFEYKETFQLKEIVSFFPYLDDTNAKLSSWKFGFRVKLAKKELILYAETEKDRKRWEYAFLYILGKLPQTIQKLPQNKQSSKVINNQPVSQKNLNEENKKQITKKAEKEEEDEEEEDEEDEQEEEEEDDEYEYEEDEEEKDKELNIIKEEEEIKNKQKNAIGKLIGVNLNQSKNSENKDENQSHKDKLNLLEQKEKELLLKQESLLKKEKDFSKNKDLSDDNSKTKNKQGEELSFSDRKENHDTDDSPFNSERPKDNEELKFQSKKDNELTQINQLVSPKENGLKPNHTFHKNIEPIIENISSKKDNKSNEVQMKPECPFGAASHYDSSQDDGDFDVNEIELKDSEKVVSYENNSNEHYIKDPTFQNKDVNNKDTFDSKNDFKTGKRMKTNESRKEIESNSNDKLSKSKNEKSQREEQNTEEEKAEKKYENLGKKEETENIKTEEEDENNEEQEEQNEHDEKIEKEQSIGIKDIKSIDKDNLEKSIEKKDIQDSNEKMSASIRNDNNSNNNKIIPKIEKKETSNNSVQSDVIIKGNSSKKLKSSNESDMIDNHNNSITIDLQKLDIIEAIDNNPLSGKNELPQSNENLYKNIEIDNNLIEDQKNSNLNSIHEKKFSTSERKNEEKNEKDETISKKLENIQNDLEKNETNEKENDKDSDSKKNHLSKSTNLDFKEKLLSSHKEEITPKSSKQKINYSSQIQSSSRKVKKTNVLPDKESMNGEILQREADSSIFGGESLNLFHINTGNNSLLKFNPDDLDDWNYYDRDSKQIRPKDLSIYNPIYTSLITKTSEHSNETEILNKKMAIMHRRLNEPQKISNFREPMYFPIKKEFSQTDRAPVIRKNNEINLNFFDMNNSNSHNNIFKQDINKQNYKGNVESVYSFKKKNVRQAQINNKSYLINHYNHSNSKKGPIQDFLEWEPK